MEAIRSTLALGDERLATFKRRDVAFDRYRALPWFIDPVGIIPAP